MNIAFTHTTSLRVRYGETDQMGYCYYGNYAQYFEVGRVETMRLLGMSYRQLEEQGVMLPVSDFSVKYKLPALYDDLLHIQTTITNLQGARLRFDYQITNEAGKLIATAETTLVFVAKNTMRPISPPDYFMQVIAPYILNNAEPV
jgi:acyl-CoA thioester hydrolase